MADRFILLINWLKYLCILCIKWIHSILTKMNPSSFLLFLIKIIWIFATLFKEETRHILIFFLSSHTIQLHQTDLNLLMTWNASFLAFSKTANNMVCHSFHYMKQLIFSSRLIIGHCRFHHMTCAIKFMTFLQILPTMLWLLNCKIGVQISIWLLCLFNNIDNLICALFKCRIWLNCQ